MFVEHKEALEAPVEKKITKLSEAIRLGARLRPKCTGQFFRMGASCALGAAYEALFGYPGDTYGSRNDGSFMAAIMSSDIPIPQLCIEEVGTIKNDKQGWPREAIADWLEAQGY